MKSKFQHYLIIGLGALLLPAGLSAQIYVDAENEVGIGTTLPGSKLEVITSSATHGTNVDLTNNYTGSSNQVGIENVVNNTGTGSRYGIRNFSYATTTNSGYAYGMYNVVNGGTWYTYGIYNNMYQPSTATGNLYGVINYMNADGNGTAYGNYVGLYSANGVTGNRYGYYATVENAGTGTKYGIYTSVSGAGNYAGYFSGNVTVTGTFSNPSDARTKQNVRPIASALHTVGQLQPRSYEYRQDMGMNLPEGQQFGFVAQDLEQVLPQLVTQIKAPIDVEADHDAARKGEYAHADPTYTEIKAVNYIGLIPILTQAIQELQGEVKAQAAEIATLKAQIKH
jgi:hypothetical protein